MGNYKERIVKGRYEYVCTVCDKRILKGEEHRYVLSRYLMTDQENGEEYMSQWQSHRLHNFDCVTPIECQKGNHVFQNVPDEMFLGMVWIKGSERCINCSKEKYDSI